MTKRSVHFSSKKSSWETPQDFFDALDKEFCFTLDVCATKSNAKCEKFYTRSTNGLRRPWTGVCWMNPPYGRAIGAWVRRAFLMAESGDATTIALLPARTDTSWWHDCIWNSRSHSPHPGIEVRLLRGRLKFGNSKNSAPFPSAVVIFRSKALQVFGRTGPKIRASDEPWQWSVA